MFYIAGINLSHFNFPPPKLHMSVCLLANLYLSVYLPTYLSIHPSVVCLHTYIQVF